MEAKLATLQQRKIQRDINCDVHMDYIHMIVVFDVNVNYTYI